MPLPTAKKSGSNRNSKKIRKRRIKSNNVYQLLETRRLLAGDVMLASSISDLLTPSTSLGDSNFATTSGANVRNSVVSADGRFVVFQSLSDDLVVNDNNGRSDVFRYDRVLDVVDLVSVSVTGVAADNSSNDPVISADGSVVAFRSQATDLVESGTGGSEIFVRNFTTGTTELVSVELDGLDNSGNASGSPVISADGNVVAFFSSNNDLAENDDSSGGGTDLFARNLTTGVTSLVNVDFDGQVDGTGGSGEGGVSFPAINSDGSVIAFSSNGRNLVNIPDPTLNSSTNNVFARNLLTNTTTLVSVSSDGNFSADQSATEPSISADGNIVVFESNSTNLSNLDNDTQFDVFAFDISTGTTTLVSINEAGDDSGDSSSMNPAISADGSTIVFQSAASDLVPGDALQNLGSDIFAFRFDDGTTTSGSTTLVSPRVPGSNANFGSSIDPVVNHDGTVVAFESSANNLVDESTPAFLDVFVRDLVLETTSFRSAGLSGENGASEDIAISGDGSTVAFESTAPDLVTGDLNGDRDVFVRSTFTDDPIELASRVVPANATATPDRSSQFAPQNQSVSANGRFIVFESAANNIVPGDNNSNLDVFRYDLLYDVVELVSINRDGSGTGNNPSENPVISADGSIVAFESSATDLTDDTTLGFRDVFVRNFDTGETSLVSVNFDGNGSGTGTSSEPVISADGNVIAFTSSANNLLPGVSGSQVYVRNLNETTTSLVSVSATDATDGSSGSKNDVVISDDGSVVAFSSNSTNLSLQDQDTRNDIFARDLTSSTTILVSAALDGNSGDGDSLFPIISGDGSTIVFSSNASDLTALANNPSNDLFARNIETGTTFLVNEFNDPAGSTIGSFTNPDISFDGSRVVFQSTSTNLVAGATGTSADVFIRDLNAGTTELVSVDFDGSEVNSSSINPVISGDGTIVAFASSGQDLLEDNTGVSGRNIFVRDLSTGTTGLVSVALDVGGGNGTSDNPMISADGNVIAFDSDASDLVENDGNAFQDVFVVSFNTPPVINPQTFTTPEDDSGVSPTGTVIATDAESAVTFEITGGDSSLFQIDSVTGQLSVVPGTVLDFETAPVLGVVVTVADTFGLTASADITIELTNVNEAPEIPGSLASQVFEEDTTLTISSADLTALFGLPGAVDVDADNPNGVLATTLQITDDSANVLFTQSIDLTNIADISFTPPQDFFGNLTGTFAVTDLGGLSDSSTFAITVNPVNDAPVIPGVLGSQSTDEDVTLTISAADLTGLLGSSLDVDNLNSELVTELEITDAGGNVLFTQAIDLTIITDISFTPPQDFFGNLTGTITASDPDGLSDTSTFNITVNPINDAPVISGVLGGQATDEDVTLTISAADLTGLLGSSLDVDDLNSELVTELEITDTSGSVLLTQTIDLTNITDISFTPPQDFFGSLTGTFAVSDPDGLSDTSTFAITVNPVNDAPVIPGVLGDQTTDEDVTLTISAADLTGLLGSSLDVDNLNNELATDLEITDASGNVLFTQTIDLTNIADISFTPPQDFFGNLKGTITASDPDGLSDTSTFSITVNPINDAPVFTSGDQFSVVENSQFVGLITASDVEQSGAEIQFSVLTGLDGANFEIVNGNELQFSISPDFEQPQDLDNNNVYALEVEASDGLTTTRQTIEVTVEDLDEIAPTADIVDITPDPQNSVVDSVVIEFDEAVSGVDIGDFTLTRDGQTVDISGLVVSQVSPEQYTIDLSSVTDVDGVYELALNGAGSGITDSAGNALVDQVFEEFAVDRTGPTVESIVINNGAAIRSIVNVITVTFSEVVSNVTADSFVLQNTDKNTLVTPEVNTAIVNGQTVATLTFTGSEFIGGSLADGNYRLTVLDTVEDAAGNRLDGDEDGSQGGNVNEEFFRLYGDFNGDRRINIFDFLMFRKAFAASSSGNTVLAEFDFEGDGAVGISDFLEFRKRFGTTI